MGFPGWGAGLIRIESELFLVHIERAVFVRNEVFLGFVRCLLFQFLHQYALALAGKQWLAFIHAIRQISRKTHAVIQVHEVAVKRLHRQDYQENICEEAFQQRFPVQITGVKYTYSKIDKQDICINFYR